jgi:hypothetical protein
MVSSVSTSLALIPWTEVSHRNSLPVRYSIPIRAPEMSIDEEQGTAHREPESMGYDQHGHVYQQTKRGFFIDSYG